VPRSLANNPLIPPLYVITKGGFPFDVEGYGFGYGTYSSRLKGNAGQITRNVQKEIGESLKQLPSEISLYLMHRDDFDSLNYELIDRVQTPVQTILEALSEPSLRSMFPSSLSID
jgi:aryl-alcohol dehydrogenase-like predicted oxidoreductase